MMRIVFSSLQNSAQVAAIPENAHTIPFLVRHCSVVASYVNTKAEQVADKDARAVVVSASNSYKNGPQDGANNVSDGGHRGGPSRRQPTSVKGKQRKGVGRQRSSELLNFPLGNGLVVKLSHVPRTWIPQNTTTDRQRCEHQEEGVKGTEIARSEANQAAHKDAYSAESGSDMKMTFSPETSVGLPKVAAAAVANVPLAKENNQLQKALETWQGLLHRFQVDCLPVVLQCRNEVQPSVASFAHAFQVVIEMLCTVSCISRLTGLRAERLFPAELVVVLWTVLSSFRDHVGARTKGVTSEQGNMKNSTTDSDEEVKADRTVLDVNSPAHKSPRRVFKTARRVLALRALELDDMLPPSLIVQVLLAMEHCGALSDDIIGPMATKLLQRYEKGLLSRGAAQHVACNHRLSTYHVASALKLDEAPFSGKDAVNFACLLGRIKVVNHFQLHRLLHVVLLPALMPALRAEAPSMTSLFELTACYAMYAVSGSAVEQLTVLWSPHLHQMSLEQCTELLSAVSPGESPVGWRRRHGSSSRRHSVPTGAEEDYFPLVAAILERIARLCVSDMWPKDAQNDPTGVTTTSIVATGPVSRDISSTACLMKLMRAMTRVNAECWGEVYVLVASKIEQHLEYFSTAEVVHLSKSIMQRGSHMPYHTLHQKLAQRLIRDETALSDVEVASVALLSAALMLPSLSQMNSSSQIVVRSEGPSHLANSLARLTKSNAPYDTVTAARDSKAALNVFRRHGTRLGLRSFVAGLCVAPLEKLPRRSKERVVVHFTSIASAMEVSWLTRGIVALASKIPDAVDPLSVQRWFSRFTAVDVTRQLDLEHAAMLLNILSNESHSRNCAMAKRAITTRVARLLLHEDVALDSVAVAALALQQADVFFPHLYSRVCRVLLSYVQRASWDELLPVFHIAADEFTRRQHGSGCVFRDVWELLRTRLVNDAAVTLTPENVVTALNGFAALDVGDYPVFAVIVHRLWAVFRAVTSEGSRTEGATAADMTFSGVGSCAASAVVTCSKWTPWIDGILSGFTPSALAVLTCTLTHMDDGEAVDTFMPWVLLRLRPAVKDLFPIDTVHLMTALLANFSKAASLAAESSNHPQWLATHSNCNLLHVVYDTCRGLFLQMYGEEDQKSSGDGANRPCRKDWSPKTRASVASVPSRHFAEILVALCRAGVRDEAVAKACAGRVTPRCCMMLPIAQLVDVTLALCFHFHPRSLDMEETNLVGDVGVMETGEGVPLPVKSQPTSGRCDTDVAQEATQCKKLLPPALNALWERVEELRPSQVDALVRCLRHYYGEKVDVDFLSRLQKHTAVIKGMKGDTQQQQNEEQSSGGCTTVSDAAKSPGAATRKEPEAMGSQYQLSAEDLFTC